MPVSVCVIVSSGTLFTPVNITLTSVDDSAVGVLKRVLYSEMYRNYSKEW